MKTFHIIEILLLLSNFTYCQLVKEIEIIDHFWRSEIESVNIINLSDNEITYSNKEGLFSISYSKNQTYEFLLYKEKYVPKIVNIKSYSSVNVIELTSKSEYRENNPIGRSKFNLNKIEINGRIIVNKKINHSLEGIQIFVVNLPFSSFIDQNNNYSLSIPGSDLKKYGLSKIHIFLYKPNFIFKIDSLNINDLDLTHKNSLTLNFQFDLDQDLIGTSKRSYETIYKNRIQSVKNKYYTDSIQAKLTIDSLSAFIERTNLKGRSDSLRLRKSLDSLITKNRDSINLLNLAYQKNIDSIKQLFLKQSRIIDSLNKIKISSQKNIGDSDKENIMKVERQNSQHSFNILPLTFSSQVKESHRINFDFQISFEANLSLFTRSGSKINSLFMSNRSALFFSTILSVNSSRRQPDYQFGIIPGEINLNKRFGISPGIGIGYGYTNYCANDCIRTTYLQLQIKFIYSFYSTNRWSIFTMICNKNNFRNSETKMNGWNWGLIGLQLKL